MNKIRIVLVFAVVLLSCVQGKADDKKIVVDNTSIVIDVRTEKEYNEGHLENAINIPYTEIGEKINAYVKDKKERIILYCRSGRRSGIAKNILKGMGYENVINAGAYEELKKQEIDRKNKKSKNSITSQHRIARPVIFNDNNGTGKSFLVYSFRYHCCPK
ncbi:MAG: rhodanese-like domain-containing protein [Desulfobacterales bacterium]|nr:rhodanese-like domain-containing protein [Desulfobacterales bacterium]